MKHILNMLPSSYNPEHSNTAEISQSMQQLHNALRKGKPVDQKEGNDAFRKNRTTKCEL